MLLFYQNAEPFVLLTELSTNIFAHTHEYYNVHDTYNIQYIKQNGDLYNIQKELNIMNLNTEQTIINPELHIKNKTIIVINFIMGILILVGSNLLQLFMYKHETNSIKKIIYGYSIISITLLIYNAELNANNILKKNINNTEILYNTQIETNTFIITILIILCIYNVYSSFIYKKNKSIQKKSSTKITIVSIILLSSIMLAQYSIYESIIILIYAEVIEQLVTIYRCINKPRTPRLI